MRLFNRLATALGAVVLAAFAAQAMSAVGAVPEYHWGPVATWPTRCRCR